jgi:serine/threonine protein kinase
MASGSDVWSLGCTLYCFAFQRLPFPATEFEKLERSILTEQPEFPPTPAYSESMLSFLKACLVKDAAHRPSITALLGH